MNTDQINSLIRTLLKVIGTALATHGLTQAAGLVNSEDIIGLILATVGVFLSHNSHGSDSTTTKGGVSAWIMFAMLPLLLFGCKTAQLEQGGAYSPVVTNAAGDVVLATQPEQALYVTDAAYKLAYDTAYGVCKFERDNRVQIAAISSSIKLALDKARPTIVDIDRRWATARKAYKENPTPAGLDTIQSIVAEIQRLVPVVQAELEPVYSTVTSNQ